MWAIECSGQLDFVRREKPRCQNFGTGFVCSLGDGSSPLGSRSRCSRNEAPLRKPVIFYYSCVLWTKAKRYFVGSGTFPIHLLFPGLRRFVYFVWRGVVVVKNTITTGNVCARWDRYHSNMSINLKIRQQQSSTLFIFANSRARTRPPSLVRYTNRPFGHQSRYPKRPIIN